VHFFLIFIYFYLFIFIYVYSSVHSRVLVVPSEIHQIAGFT